MCQHVSTASCFFLRDRSNNTRKFSEIQIEGWKPKKENAPNRRNAWLQLMILSSIGIEIRTENVCLYISWRSVLISEADIESNLWNSSTIIPEPKKTADCVPPWGLQQSEGWGGEFGEPVQGSARVSFCIAIIFHLLVWNCRLTCNFWEIHIFPACVFDNHFPRTEAPPNFPWLVQLQKGTSFPNTQRPGELLAILSLLNFQVLPAWWLCPLVKVHPNDTSLQIPTRSWATGKSTRVLGIYTGT